MVNFAFSQELATQNSLPQNSVNKAILVNQETYTKCFGIADGAICQWDYNKKATVVLTFDDWTPGQFPLVVPELKRHKMIATFFPILTNIEKYDYSWKAIKKVIENGNEVGSHTVTHPDLTKCSDGDLQKEITEPIKTVAEKNNGYKVLTLAYPYGTGAGYSEADLRVITALRATGHIGARSVWGISNYSYNFAPTDDDYYRIQIYGMNEKTTNQQFYSEVEKTIVGGGLITYLYHSVDDDLNSYNDTWYAQVKLDSLRAQLNFLKKNEDKIWVTTFRNALLYHREASKAELIVDKKQNEITARVQLSDEFFKLVPKDCLIPLSVMVFKNENKTNITSITQNGTAIPIDKQTDDYIQFRIIPNGEPAILK